MDDRFSVHNAHREDPGAFAQRDPQLRVLARQPHRHRPELLGRFPAEPGIYTLGGGRQVGKTTLLKLWVSDLLAAGVAPRRILFLTGELIDDHHSLLRLLQDHLSGVAGGFGVVILDEVTYVRGWDRAIKFAADAGLLETTALMLSGADLALIREMRAWLPGRRGNAAAVDFHLAPLSFREVVDLVAPELNDGHDVESLFSMFDRYLAHGGYLTAINDWGRDGTIARATLATYADWIRGDMAKRGKQEHYLRAVLEAIVRRYGSQVSWNALARDLPIDHPATIADYVHLLESMDAVFVQHAVAGDRLAAAPKKARKVMFSDPFILHAVRSWLWPGPDPFRDQVLAAVGDAQWSAWLAEACVATHVRRCAPTYYVKGKGEIDVAYVHAGRLWPVEVKWTGQLRPKSLAEIARCSNGRILTRSRRSSVVHGVPTEPLPLALLRLPWH